ncbi:MAG: cell envelope biogenesis protein TolA, partial [Rhodoblastus sp.]
AEALAAATPAALAASEAAQKFLADAAAPAPSPPPSSPHLEQAQDEDNLRLIQGVDKKSARELHNLGVWRFGQIAAWTPEQQQWIGEKMRRNGPLARLYWVAQARLLTGGVEPEFSRAVRQGDAGYETMEAPLDEAAAGLLLAALPQVITPHANDEIYAGLRPLSLLQPPDGEKDELARISGIDREIAERLEALGVWTYAQIARWSQENARWIGSYLAFPGRVEAENWVVQARELAEARNACADDSTSA